MSIHDKPNKHFSRKGIFGLIEKAVGSAPQKISFAQHVIYCDKLDNEMEIKSK